MSRAKTAIDGKDVNLALRLLTAAIDIKPDFAEAWNRRADAAFHPQGIRGGDGGSARGARSASHAISPPGPGSA